MDVAYEILLAQLSNSLTFIVLFPQNNEAFYSIRREEFKPKITMNSVITPIEKNRKENRVNLLLTLVKCTSFSTISAYDNKFWKICVKE